MTLQNRNREQLLLMPGFIVTFVGLAVMAILISGCASTTPKPSGFLSDYSNLVPYPAKEGALFYENPHAPLEEYDKCIIDPTSICVGPTSRGVALRGDVISFTEDRLREQLTRVVSDHYKLTSEPGPGVLRLRVAVTTILARTKIEPLSHQTGTMLFWPGSSVLEAESVDSVTGEQVSAYMSKSFLQNVNDPDNPDFDLIRKAVQRRVAELEDALRHVVGN